MRGIYSIDRDGNNLQLLTERRDWAGLGGPADTSYLWSPDGTRIAFLGQDGLYVMNASGTGERRIAPFDRPYSSPASTLAWSPDGQRIAFTVERYSETERRVVLETHVVGLTRERPVRLGEGSSPVWLPGGSRIAVVVWEDAEAIVKIYNADGSGQPQRFLDASQVSWSPDGKRIVFTR